MDATTNVAHGGPYDRGRADAHLNRKPDPHKYPLGTYNGERVVLTCPKEIAAYFAGYLDHTTIDSSSSKDSNSLDSNDHKTK